MILRRADPPGPGGRLICPFVSGWVCVVDAAPQPDHDAYVSVVAALTVAACQVAVDLFSRWLGGRGRIAQHERTAVVAGR